MNKKKWIWIGMTLLVIALTATIIGINSWYNSGNVRVMGGRVRVDLEGIGYVIDQETGELIGQSELVIRGQSDSANKEIFVGRMEVMGYLNEADGTMATNKGVLKGDDGYWEIRRVDNCSHLETDEKGESKVVNHSCKYSYIYYIHPDKQDHLVVRIKDKYKINPVYVVLADSEDEAMQIYREFTAGRF